MIDFKAARTAMVDRQVRPADVTDYAIIEAMLWAPRERFAPLAWRDVAYAGEHMPLGDGRVALDCRTFAKMLEVADIGSDDLVLDLAPGTGYSTAVLGRLAAAVVGVEPDETMAHSATQALGELGVDNAVVIEGDPAAGDADHGPFDVILINGAIERAPESLLAQLKDGGRMVAIWREGALGQCRVTRRVGDTFATRRAFDASAPVVPGFEAPKAFVF